ncbi:MAG: MGMT family protein [Syntrophales bacterium]|nr:MGMT family protein [Syntrophales bacterium]
MMMDQKRTSYTYEIIPSTLGEIGLVRRADGGRSPICRILLPEAGRHMAGKIRDLFPDAVPGRGKQDEINKQIRDFLTGAAVDFRLENLDFGSLKGFTRRVLLADGMIPRGRVMTYGGLAASVGVAGGARAVGNVMAGNPFPLVIPCHRVVRSGGSLGGFGGGVEMKKALLMMEGVAFDAQGRVLPEYLFMKC